ncbi:unnamed protein product [Oppiella nova]|uniref:Uncharacterized protein n=1 Tax=Oppiella nova TaxID=334625 RepID=A0A7R9QP30_9ACAR|nr:unnamed protein product [Oppiella nova]CAG2169121.1 unnamed protein product [Oppiella nova]
MYSSPSYKNYVSESSSSFYHKILRDDDDIPTRLPITGLKNTDYSGRSTSKYLFGNPSTKFTTDDYSSSYDKYDTSNKYDSYSSSYDKINTYDSNAYDKYDKSYTSSYDKYYDKTYDKYYENDDKCYEKDDKYYEKDDKFYEKYDMSYDKSSSDDKILQHSNSYFNIKDSQYLSPDKRVYGSPPPLSKSGSGKRVHYDLNSSGSVSSSGARSDTPFDTYTSSYGRSYTPDPNVCPVHPYRSQPPLILHESVGAPFRHLHGPNSSYRSALSESSDFSGRKPHFVPITRLDDAQAIRAAEFHPNGQLYAIGSNSKTLRLCGYPKSHELRTLSLAWNTTGDLLATGSNDKSIKMMRYNAIAK